VRSPAQQLLQLALWVLQCSGLARLQCPLLAELLLERPAHPDVPREHLRVIHDQAERAGRIVRNLLTFARKGGISEKTAVDLNDVVTRTSLLIVYELQLHGIDLNSELSSDPVIVLGDRYELQQVLLNLITNAVQAVSSLPAGRPRKIVVATARLDQQALLRVRDTGPGVTSQNASSLFTPFFTTKAPGQGTGLGLSLSYGLVKSHEGELSYDPPLEGVEPPPLGPVDRDDELPALDVRQPALGAVVPQHQPTAGAELGLEAARPVVEPRVHHA